MSKLIFPVIIIFFLFSCASSIVEGEFVKTSNNNYPPKNQNTVIDIYMAGKIPQRETIEIGIVTSRAWVLEKGMNELKTQARELGADAIVNVIYERRFSVDYLQDLYYFNGKAIIWKKRHTN